MEGTFFFFKKIKITKPFLFFRECGSGYKGIKLQEGFQADKEKSNIGRNCKEVWKAKGPKLRDNCSLRGQVFMNYQVFIQPRDSAQSKVILNAACPVYCREVVY